MRDRVLIFGGSGMLGHKLSQVISKEVETFVTMRNGDLALAYPGVFSRTEVIDRVDAQNVESIDRAFQIANPTVVVNAVGVVKQIASSKDAVNSISVNSVFPHRLAERCVRNGIRLISVSTDCVFSGNKGNYAESDRPDPEDQYGRTKLLGEIEAENCLTIRTSIIGPQIQGEYSLLEWFLRQKGGCIKGFRKAIFTGWPTVELSEIIARVITRHRDLSGIFHIATQPITKFDLLSLINEAYKLNVEIAPDDVFDCNRSLNGERFQVETGIKARPWKELVQKMHEDSALYTVTACSNSK
ncbi:MAG: SDR family oxidoreductase [Candidatus Melainabacteria bacterium]|nr:SDR family oxidoreductase [Candidatus Melainabacteria bacterium]